VRSFWRVFGAVLAVAFLGAVWLVYRALGWKRAANEAVADMVDARASVRIRAQHDHIEALESKLGKDHVVVEGAKAALIDERRALTKRYESLELTPDEMELRFSRLRL
jgi:hypothetical protein